ncbi:MAG: BON domain-containing protein [Pseudomonadota bacterium]|nr:BON domain-containing protein [Pseudomonadota bacterium]
MQTKILTCALTLAAAASMAACTTRPVTMDTPGPGSTTVQVPVPATANTMLSTRVKESIQSSLGTNAAGIDVRAQDGTIYLTGQVASQVLHDQAVAAARGTEGVTTVVHTGLVISG